MLNRNVMRGGVVAVCAGYAAAALTPNDVAGNSDSDRFEAAIAQAVATGENEVVIPRFNARTGEEIWLITRAILLPSNLRLVLDDCLVRLAPGTQDNLIRNVGTATVPMGGNTNIAVVGRGRATLSGGTEAHFDPPGDKSGWRTIGILLYNTQNFALRDFKMEETQSWAISMENGCAYGCVSNITFSNTNKYPNQDGVDVRKGCHHISIVDIFGVTGDDSVALTGLRSSLDGSVTSRMQIGDGYPAASDDIHDIVVRHIRTYVAGGHHTVRLLNHDGIKLYNIAIDDVYDQSVAGQIRATAGLKIGDSGYWTLAQNQLGETHTIFVTNLNSRASSVVLIQGTLKDAVLCNLRPSDGATPLTVGVMPTQNIVVCEAPESPPVTSETTVEMQDVVLEVDLAPSGCDVVNINGDLRVGGETRVEILTDNPVLLKTCRTNTYVICRWNGNKEGLFCRTTNQAGWYVGEDAINRQLLLAYRNSGLLIGLR